MLREPDPRFLLGALALASCAAPPAVTPAPIGACRGVLEALAAHHIVLLGESHRSAPCHRFLRELVRTPGFADRVDDIVIECGNSRHQPILDRYIAGEDVPIHELQQVWRNTTQLLVWDSPLYAEFLATVRSVNADLPPERRLRVLAGDPPIDWAQTMVPADFPRSYGDRDIETLHILEREVLQRGRRALVVIGGAHVYRQGPGFTEPPALERASLGDQLQRLYPGASYAIETSFGDGRREVSRLLRERLMCGEMLRLDGDALGAVNSNVLFGSDITLFRVVDGKRVAFEPAADHFPPLAHVVDAFVYLGVENEQVLASPEVYAGDPDYTAEIRRRIGVLSQVFGGDFWSEELDTQLAQAKRPAR